jgi:hypothetical protein
MKKLFLKIFLRIYLSKNREINKLTPEQELQKFLFNDPSSIYDILRSLLTTQTISYWEAKSEYERNIIKGQTLVLRLLLELHRRAKEIDKKYKNPKLKIAEWIKINYKITVGE